MLDAPSQAEWEAQRREAMDAMPSVIDQVGLPAVLLPYQQRTVSLLDSVSTKALYIEKSRRIGLTWALAAYAVLRAGRQKSAGGMDVMYISYSREMTREFIDACAMWARAFSIAALAEEEFLFEQGDDGGDKAIQAFRIPFASGFEIMALSSAPRGLRGKQGVVIIDEAAFVDSLDTLIEAAMAFLMWGGQVVVCSTHYGVDNPFNASIQDVLSERAPGEHLRIDLDDALRDGLYQRICLVKGTEWTPEGEAAWRAGIVKFYGASADQELFCVPSASSGTWLPSPLIDARMTIDKPVIRLTLPADFLQRSNLEQRSLVAPFMEQIEEELGGLDMTMRYALGFDVGRVADISSVPLLAIDQKLRQHEALSIEMRNVPFKEQLAAVELVMNHVRNRMVGAAVDATGIGMSIAEALGRKFGLREDEEGSGLVWAIKFSEDWYRVNMPPLKAAFEDDTLALIQTGDARGPYHVASAEAVTCVMRFPAQGIPYMEFDFLGLFAVPVEQARVTPTLTGFLKPDVVTSARTPVFNLNGNPFVMRSCALNLGNQVEGRFLVGSESILITDKADTLECTVEAVPVSTFNPIALAESQASVEVELQHGNVAGRIATLTAPTAQMQRLQSLENQQMIKEWPLRFVPVPATGNDQWTLTLT